MTTVKIQLRIDKLEQFFIRKKPWPKTVEEKSVWIDSDDCWSGMAPRLKDDSLVIEEGDWIVTYSDDSLQVVKCDLFQEFINDILTKLLKESS